MPKPSRPFAPLRAGRSGPCGAPPCRSGRSGSGSATPLFDGTELATSSADRPLVATANQLALRLQAPPTRPRNLTLPACVLDRAQPLVGPDADQAYADFRRRRWPHMQCLSLVCRARGERGYLASAGSNYEGGPASVVRAIARQSDCEQEQRQAYAWHEGRENGRRIMHGSRRAWGRADTPGDTCKAAAP